MSKKKIENEEQSLEELEEQKVIKDKKKKKEKKKMTKNDKRKLVLKIMGWIMALVMLLGSLISIFGMLLYK